MTFQTSFRWVLMMAMAFSFVGCVAQGEADRQQRLLREKDDRIATLMARLEEKDAEIAALRNRGAMPDPDLLARLEQAQADRDRLEAELRDLMGRFGELSTGPLPAAVDDALMRLAASNPDLMTYDPKLGMIRFASDLTFALGSAEVRSGAVGSLNQLAQILNSGEARNYEVRVVGHTDNVPIGNPETRRQHPTNRHLSVHRAIAVKQVLRRANVEPHRIATAGYGEYRPAVPNNPAGGTEANRRVEIYLVQMPDLSTQPAPVRATPTDAAPRQQAPAQPQPNDALFK